MCIHKLLTKSSNSNDDASNVRVLISAFKEKNTWIKAFDVIEHSEAMDSDELMERIKRKFTIYLEFNYYSAQDYDVHCRIMFIRKRDEGKRWTYFMVRDEKFIHPFNYKWMTLVFEYDKNGEINRIYDDE